MRIVVTADPVACDGHGLCADLFSERIVLDDWGYPIISEVPVPPELEAEARRAVAACPRLALSLRTVDEPVSAPS